MGTGATFICGDVIETLRSLDPDIAQLVVTSPPYFNHRDYGVVGQIGRERSLAEYLDKIKSVLSELLRVTKETGCCFFVIGDTYRNRKLLLVPHRIALIADDLGWTVRNDLIWQKASPAPESPTNRWRSGHEHVLFLTKRSTGYYFDADAGRVPYSAQTLRRWGAGQVYGGQKSRNRHSAKDSRMRDGQTFRLHPNGCLPPDVWCLPSSNSGLRHYAAFPEELVRRAVEVCSAPGDLVIDPFAGTGTTIAVASRLGRRGLGIELNPSYVLTANERILQADVA